ncbi:MAG TPA: hypothetical protein VD903_03830 [Pseudonocardia sp.]|jgi:hypothetical protein|nr:hypothetical protein [Pseudonocardia sp.]
MTIEQHDLIREPTPDPDVLRTLDCLYGDADPPEEPGNDPVGTGGSQPITA